MTRPIKDIPSEELDAFCKKDGCVSDLCNENCRFHDICCVPVEKMPAEILRLREALDSMERARDLQAMHRKDEREQATKIREELVARGPSLWGDAPEKASVAFVMFYEDHEGDVAVGHLKNKFYTRQVPDEASRIASLPEAQS